MGALYEVKVCGGPVGGQSLWGPCRRSKFVGALYEAKVCGCPVGGQGLWGPCRTRFVGAL